VLQQSLAVNAPSTVSQFAHHLSLLNHKSESQKKESLSHLTTVVESNDTLPQPASSILPKVLPLVLDISSGVRSQTLKLLSALPKSDIRDNAEQLLLYSRAAMTHLSSRIRLTGLDMLELLLNVAGEDVITSPGGWMKSLKAMLGLLGWSQEPPQSKSSGGWKSTGAGNAVAKSEDETKVVTRQLQVFSLLLEVALLEPKTAAQSDGQVAQHDFPLWNLHQTLIPKQSNPYGHLNLFGSLRDEESEQYEDRSDRIRLYQKYAAAGVQKGIDRLKREGGGIGRGAMGVDRVIEMVRDDTQ
jgi:pre-rRNA-processing protein IPI1